MLSAKLRECLITRSTELDLKGKLRQADVFDTALKAVAGASDRTFEKGMREGLDAAVTLLENATDMEAIREVTSYLREVRDNIPRETAGEVIENTHLIETPDELNSLMAFDD